LANYLGIKKSSKAFKNIEWLGLLKNEKIGLKDATPAAVLLKCLLKKWQLKKNELDMVVMKHEIDYTLQKKQIHVGSSLVIKGEDQTYTAMAKTVGLPMAIAARHILNGNIKETGVHIPILPCFYEPILKELKQFGIDFIEKTQVLSGHK
jgi:saccharopine dehydrogenase-like NADP-dependent oxidoreductase